MTLRGCLWDKRVTSSRRPEEPGGGDVSLRCPSCGHPNRADRRYCAACGSHLGQACPSCGTRNNPEEKFCGACGAALTEAAAEGERRQLTVLFCDLVGSTAMAGQLDPEDWREIAAEYQRAAAETVTRFGGHVAKYLGDGLLVYFGYPHAHEDDPERAVRGGLALIDTVAELNHRLEPAHGVRLAVRVGMHTGPVVIGEGPGPGAEVFGDTPNVAARVQALADPDAVLITEATHRLVAGRFIVEAKGAPPLKGVRTPVAVYRVVQASGVRSRLAAAGPRGLTLFVGREAERRLLGERWAQARAGEGQVVLITGEAGIGKSRLVQTFKEDLAREPHMWIECSGSVYHHLTPFHPIADMLHQGLGWGDVATPAERLDTLERSLDLAGVRRAEAVPLVAPLLGLPVSEGYPPLALSPEGQRKRLLGTLVAWLVGLARVQPVVAVLEDLHWVDPSTLELQGRFVEQGATAPILLLYTARPEFRAPWPLLAHHAQVTLGRLGPRQVREMVAQVAVRVVLAEPVIEAVVARTDGVPLYVEELTKTVLEADEGGATSARTIPATLQDSLMARLDRLGGAKEVAQVGAVIGREFSYALLHAISPLPEAELQAALVRLTDAELLYPRGLPPEATYVFKHALVQETAYETLLKVRRRQHHERIAQVLVERFPDLAVSQPEVMAHHYTAAGLAREAVAYWQQAAEHATQRSANREAASHLTRGLELLRALPDTPERTQQELALQSLLGSVYLVSRGYGAPETEAAFARAQELCQQMGATARMWPALRGLVMFYFIRGQLATARELGEELLTLARSAQDRAMLVEAHHALGWTLFWRGEFARAGEVLAEGVATYDRERHGAHAFLYGQDPRISSLVAWALALWHLGYSNEARTKMEQALGLARELAHPYTLTFTLFAAAWFHMHLRDARGAQELADAAIAIAAEQEFPHARAIATAMRGWALVERGQVEEGIAEMHQGLVAADTIGAVIDGLSIMGLLAEACGRIGHTENGGAELARALERARAIEGCYYDAELHRIKGELLLKRSLENGVEAEACFLYALEVARRQQATSLELRAATSLARLLRDQGRPAEARELLAPLYASFTEGFDTRDLVEAKALLEELG